jgi:hypothetical protein
MRPQELTHAAYQGATMKLKLTTAALAAIMSTSALPPVAQAQTVWDLVAPAPTCQSMRADVIKMGWPKDPLEADSTKLATMLRLLEVAMHEHRQTECDFTSWSFLTAAFGYYHGTQTAMTASSLTAEDLAEFKHKNGWHEEAAQ